jgi:beta-phosphoglucomutase family hydrolase
MFTRPLRGARSAKRSGTFGYALERERAITDMLCLRDKPGFRIANHNDGELAASDCSLAEPADGGDFKQSRVLTELLAENEVIMPTLITRDRYEAVLFDMDGVVTDTASVHASCWKIMFDDLLEKRAGRNTERFRPFDVDTDYKLHVDGKPRYQGVRDFLKSRGIALPEGTPEDPSTDETVCGLGNRKNELVNDRLTSAGVEAYPGTIALLKYLRRMNIKTAVVTSSQNCRAVLEAAKVEDLFDAHVDGDVLVEQGLAGKPAPDSFLKATGMLGVVPERAVVIEDAISGIRAAVQGRFGLVIGVARKGNAEELKAQGAHRVVNDLAELLS